jgi:hypothetical protein
MPAFDVKTVMVALNRGNSGGLYKGDLIFNMGGLPGLVVEWSGERGTSTPSVLVQLDPAGLQDGLTALAYGVDYFYKYPIEDPRKFQ